MDAQLRRSQSYAGESVSSSYVAPSTLGSSEAAASDPPAVDALPPSMPPPAGEVETIGELPSQGLQLLRIVDGLLMETRDRSKVFVVKQDTSGALACYVERGSAKTLFPQLAVDSATSVDGVLGLVKLVTSWYALVVTESRLAASIRRHKIFRVVAVQCVQLQLDSEAYSVEETRAERFYLQQLQASLDETGFYYSYTYPLTHSLARAARLDENVARAAGAVPRSVPFWRAADPRFFWNSHACRPMIRAQAHEFILPAIDGMVFQSNGSLSGKDFSYLLISRRDLRRTGARFRTRGADPEGHVANFVETEQIILCDGASSSFVQVRGSIPLMWHQKGKSLKPRPQLVHLPLHQRAMRKHFSELHESYGNVLIANLIDGKGMELQLREAFELQAHLMDDARTHYVGFDFHSKVKNNRFEALGELIDAMAPFLTASGFYVEDAMSFPLSTQGGVVRTNCIDCLDRTNVLQSDVARFVLCQQLQYLGIVRMTRLGEHPLFESMYKNLWADHADVMSLRYTGTGALKTDYTRTGKRSMMGLVNDGLNASVRMLNKVSRDEARQFLADIFLGKLRIERLPNLYSLIDDVDSAAAASAVPAFDPFGLLSVPEDRGRTARESRTAQERARLLAGKPTPQGTRIFRVDMIVGVLDQSPQTVGAVLMLDEPKRHLSSVLLEMRSAKLIPLAELVQMSRPATHSRMLKLRLANSAFTYDYVFPTVGQLELFISVIIALSPESLATPRLGPLVLSDGIGALMTAERHGFSIFAGAWDLSHVPYIDDVQLRSWIQPGLDLYAIGVQNCRILKPPYLDMRSPLYFALRVMRYLEQASSAMAPAPKPADSSSLPVSHYEELCMLTGGDSLLLVLVRLPLARFVHQCRYSYLMPALQEKVVTDDALVAPLREQSSTDSLIERTLNPFMKLVASSSAAQSVSGSRARPSYELNAADELDVTELDSQSSGVVVRPADSATMVRNTSAHSMLVDAGSLVLSSSASAAAPAAAGPPEDAGDGAAEGECASSSAGRRVRSSSTSYRDGAVAARPPDVVALPPRPHSSPFLGEVFVLCVGSMSLAFLHSSVPHRSAPAIVGGDRPGVRMDLGADFSHVFWLGGQHSSSYDRGTRWMELVASDPASASTARSAVVWRSLPNVRITNLATRDAFETGAPGPGQPVSACTVLPMPQDYPPYAFQNVSIVLRGLEVRQHPSSGSGASLFSANFSDAVLLVQAPFLEDGACTPVVSSNRASWSDALVLPTYVATIAALSHLSVRFVLLERSAVLGDALAGVAVLCLTELRRRRSLAIRIDLFRDDRSVGVLLGELQVDGGVSEGEANAGSMHTISSTEQLI
jgi:hypothetical protein